MLNEVCNDVQAAWIEGRLENVLQRQKELAALHARFKKAQSRLIAALCQDLSTTAASASEEINVALDAITTLYNNLDFPSSLAQERSIQAGQNAVDQLVAQGPTLIQPSPLCPVSSTILPLAAAVAAGSCCLVLCASSALNQELRAIIRASLDHEAVGVVLQDALVPDDVELLHFEVAVLQDRTTSQEFAAALRRKNPNIRIHVTSSGLPAVFVDRSVSDLDAVAGWLARAVVQSPRRHPGRVPRLCFVEEFAIEKLAWQIQRSIPAVDEAQKHGAGQSNAQEIASLLAGTFPSLQMKDLLRDSAQLPSLIVLQSSDPVNQSTISKIASLITTDYSGIILAPMTSLDHGIDLWNKINHGVAAQATYIFSASKEAFYLSRFLNSEHFFVNQIPTRSCALIAHTSSHPSYNLPFQVEDFSTNKSVFQIGLRHPGANWKLLSSGDKRLELRKISQNIGGRLSYFEQGLIVGLSVAVLSASGLGYFLFQGVRIYSR